MPRVLRHSGTVLSKVELVPLAYDGYDTRAIDRFASDVVTSDWYADVGEEYGVQNGSHHPTVTIGPAPASLTRDDIATQIKQQIMAGRVPRPAAANNQVLYLLYVPPSVTPGPGLAGVRGYHQAAVLNGIEFPLAVVFDDGRGPDEMGVFAARQMIDAATNPYEPPNDGYYADPPRIDPWSLVAREVADLCEGGAPIHEGDLVLPLVYSDRAARDGKAPCRPSASEDTWNDVSADPSTMPTIARGSSLTFVLTGWSTQELPDWQLFIRVADFSQLSEADMRPQLSDTTINNSMTVDLTLHAPLNAPSGAQGGIYVLSGTNLHPWAVGFFVR